MDCHNCIWLDYRGVRRGRCSLPQHQDVEFTPRKERRRRPYNKDKCPDFELFRRCANCHYWERGKYFSDGKTPATRGRCLLKIPRTRGDCKMWKPRSRRGP